ncbi:MAG: polyribonucleotide nucleotidyltransferase [Bacillota bacterium]|nr:MAG: polyribonucleotide nucleotidyltransferase [Bacillota bacterium]
MSDKFETTFAGRALIVEVNRVATQAGGSALVRYGDTVVLATATVSKEPREGIDFFPLLVDWEERQYSVGRIPGSFFRREGRPSERATLSARLTDRPLRPRFPKGFRNDVQVVVTVFSVDPNCAPEFAGIVGASTALCVSDAPFDGPIGMVIVGRVDGRLILNPTAEQAQASDLRVIVAASRDAVLMVEAEAAEVPEEEIAEAIFHGFDACQEVMDLQDRIVAAAGKPKGDYPVHKPSPELEERVRALAVSRIRAVLGEPDKMTREDALDDVEKAVADELAPEFPDAQADIRDVFKAVLRDEVRRLILEEGRRPDGRRPNEVRTVTCEVGLLPRAHGSGLFTRGQTQVLTIATLGSVGDVQTIDSPGSETEKRYMHHYNFPAYSVGEVRPIRGPGRREIGHGALAERALLRVIPSEADFPYTIRLVSEVLESNGSTSMGSVCGSTLALMDAGVPISAPVSGVAMGLIKEGDRFAVLTDIQGVEDFYGDMDFKVAGTRAGVTAIQMDIKATGLDRPILNQALIQAREGRLHILDRMLAVIPEPRQELSPYAPRIVILTINPDKIREVIGPGGKVINKIIAETGTQIDIEDDGRIFVAGVDRDGTARAVKMIEDITREVEVGKTYRGRVTRVTPFGAFVEVLPGKEGLVHISKLAEERVENTEDVVKVGDEIVVKCTEIDNLGRVNLSRRDVLREERIARGEPAPPGASRGDRDSRQRRDGDAGRRGDRGGRGGPGGGRRPGGPRR